MLRLDNGALTVALISLWIWNTRAFTCPTFTVVGRTSKGATSTLYARKEIDIDSLHEFDDLLREGKSELMEQTTTTARNRRAISGIKKVKMTSAVSTSSASTSSLMGEEEEEEEYMMDDDEQLSETAEGESQGDDYVDSKLLEYMEQTDKSFIKSIRDNVAEMSTRDVLILVAIPGFLAGLGSLWAVNRLISTYQEEKSTRMDNFATDIFNNAGAGESDDTLIALRKQWEKSLLLLGLTRNKQMAIYLVEEFFRRQHTVQSFDLFVDIGNCLEVGEEGLAKLVLEAMKGKNLKEKEVYIAVLISELVFKTEKALRVVDQMRNFLAIRFGASPRRLQKRKKELGFELYKNSFNDFEAGDAAPPGWSKLGLTEDQVRSLVSSFSPLDDEVNEEIDLSTPEEFNVSNREKTDQEEEGGEEKKSVSLDEALDAVKETTEMNKSEMDREIEKEEKEANVAPGSYECGNCGYTLFIAKGRESKFYGEGFTCPECGATKDKFTHKYV